MCTQKNADHSLQITFHMTVLHCREELHALLANAANAIYTEVSGSGESGVHTQVRVVLKHMQHFIAIC